MPGGAAPNGHLPLPALAVTPGYKKLSHSPPRSLALGEAGACAANGGTGPQKRREGTFPWSPEVQGIGGSRGASPMETCPMCALVGRPWLPTATLCPASPCYWRLLCSHPDAWRFRDVAHTAPAPKEPHWGWGGAQTRKETPLNQAGSGNAGAEIPSQRAGARGA